MYLYSDSEDQLKKYKENKKVNNASFNDEKELDDLIKKFQQEKEELLKVSITHILKIDI